MKDPGAFVPTMLHSEHFGGDAMFVGPISVCAMKKKSGDDRGVAVCGCEMKGSGAGCTNNGGGCISVFVVGITARESWLGASDAKRRI